MAYFVSWTISILVSIIALSEAQELLTHPTEVTALQDIRRSLVDSYHNLQNWNEGTPCSSNWTGVFCFNTTLDDGYLHIRELRLLTLNLSGTLSPSLGKLSRLVVLDFMWNNITGSIPKEIGSLKSLRLLLLNGNHLSGNLPEEIGNLPNLERFQIDENHISGNIPASYANLNAVEHFHMNNNSLSGEVPPEFSRLPKLIHLLLDNNNLSGKLPPQLSQIPNLRIMQFDNNKLDGIIPDSYGSMTKLVKLSLRNCGLIGPMPDLSKIPNLSYIDVSSNKLRGPIPPAKLSDSITTIILSENNFSGGIPSSFSLLPHLQKLSLANNSLSGSVPSTIWTNRTLNKTEVLLLNFENNELADVSGPIILPRKVTLRLKGNPICANPKASHFCNFSSNGTEKTTISRPPSDTCPPQSCPAPFEFSPSSPTPCFCAAPLSLSFRLKSPAFSDFLPYETKFKLFLTSGLRLRLFQLYIESRTWEVGPRLELDLKIFPIFRPNDTNSSVFNSTEVRRILTSLADWEIPDDKFFGPYEILYFSISSIYLNMFPPRSSNISRTALAGIIIGAISGGALVSAACFGVAWIRTRPRRASGRRESKAVKRVAGVRNFRYAEMATATDHFNEAREIGKGGYGRVYKGTLMDGTPVAIKRAQGASLQGEKEFLTEIEYLSRVHHKNLVSMIGYCDEGGEQMLVYHLMPNGTLRDNILGANGKQPPGFSLRVRIALDSARGILYLHTEADPPIFHRDIKASNILLDSQFTAKVADFGLSRIAPSSSSNDGNVAYVSTVVRGTPGYLDPEYVSTQRFSDRSDVYSFGVVLLEMLTGRKPIVRRVHIVEEVRAAWEEGDVLSMMDERMGTYPMDCADRLFELALNCCKSESDRRPSMAEVVRSLESIWSLLPVNDVYAVSNGEPSSSSPTSLSIDVSGSNLVSGTVPTINPR